jgi:hypothetical protein
MVACRYFLLLFGLVSVGSIPAVHAEEWKQHRYQADGFQVEFSGQISVTETKMSPETQKVVSRSTQYLQDGGSYAYIVTSGLYTKTPNFEGGVKSGNASGACEKLEGKPVSIPGADQGREFVGTGCKSGRWLNRYFLKGKWFYQILAIWPEDGDAESARHFVESFKLL